MYENEEINSNWYISFIQKILGIDDKSQNVMEISLSMIVIFSLGVQGIYKQPMWLKFEQCLTKNIAYYGISICYKFIAQNLKLRSLNNMEIFFYNRMMFQ